MTPEQAAAALAQQADQVRAAGTASNLVGSPQKMALQVASQVRMEASRRGHSIGIRVALKGDRVRLTVTGPNADRYRGAIQLALEQRIPQISTEVRSMITRRAK